MHADTHLRRSLRDNRAMSDRELDPDTAAYLSESTTLPPPGTATPEQMRADYDSVPRPGGDEVDSVIDDEVPGVEGPIRVRRYVMDGPPDSGLPPIAVFFHGGGWVLSSIDGHDVLARRIATRSGALVVSVDYRLAPEHPFPAAHDDAWAVTKWLSEHGADWGGDPTRLVVIGDSAGGNLAAGVALRARDEGLSIALQVLIYPCIDTEQDQYESMAQNGTGFGLTAEGMAWFWRQYVPIRHRSNPYAVPARAHVLDGVAPALIQSVEFDPLRDEAERYGRRLERAGVEETTTRYPGVVHGFVSRPHLFGRAADAHDEIGAAIRSL